MLKNKLALSVLALVVMCLTLIACGKSDKPIDPPEDKVIGLTINYDGDREFLEGYIFTVPGFTLSAADAKVSVVYQIDGGNEILTSVGDAIELEWAEYTFSYKAELRGYETEIKTLVIEGVVQQEDNTQTLKIKGYEDSDYVTNAVTLESFVLPEGVVSEGSTLKITMIKPNGEIQVVTDMSEIELETNGDYLFEYEAILDNNPNNYKNKQLTLTVKSQYRGFVTGFEDFAIDADVAGNPHVSITTEKAKDGRESLRLKTSGNNNTWPFNQPKLEQWGNLAPRFPKIDETANTISFWVYPTTEHNLAVELGFCTRDTSKMFRDNVLLIGKLTPDQWHRVSLPLPEEITPSWLKIGLTHFGIVVIGDDSYDTYYNYQNMSGVGKVTGEPYRGPENEQVTVYVDSLCFTHEEDWDSTRAFLTVAPKDKAGNALTKAGQTYVVDYKAQTTARVEVSYSLNGGESVSAKKDDEIIVHAGEYVFTYNVYNGNNTEPSLTKTMSFSVEAVTNAVMIPKYEGTSFTDSIIPHLPFDLPEATVAEGTTLKITMTDPTGNIVDVTQEEALSLVLSGEYIFNYAAINSDESVRGAKELIIKVGYVGMVADFENNFHISNNNPSKYMSISSDIFRDGAHSLKLTTSGKDEKPWNFPRIEQWDNPGQPRATLFPNLNTDANTVSFWIYPTTNHNLALSIDFYGTHPTETFYDNALLIGKLNPNEWHYVSLPLPQEFTKARLGLGLRKLGVFVIADDNYDTYYNYQDLSEVGSDKTAYKGPLNEEVTVYIDSVCFTKEADWDASRAFKPTKPTAKEAGQKYIVDYKAQSSARVEVSYTLNGSAAVNVQKGEELTTQQGTYSFTYKVFSGTELVYTTTMTFEIKERVINIPDYEDKGLKDTVDAHKDFLVPAAEVEKGLTLKITMKDPKGTEIDVTDIEKVCLEFAGLYTFKYEASKDGTIVGAAKELQITSKSKGLLLDFENFVVDNAGFPDKESATISTDKAHDGNKSLKLWSSNEKWPWNNPQLEQWNRAIPRVPNGSNTVSLWVYPTTEHKLLLAMGFYQDGKDYRFNALLMDGLVKDQWNYVVLPLPEEFTNDVFAQGLVMFGVYVMADPDYDTYYNYRDDSNIYKFGPEERVVTYIDTVCFTNEADWDATKAFKTIAPKSTSNTDLVDGEIYKVNYLAQSTARVEVSYTVNGGEPISTQKDAEIEVHTGKYVFTYKVYSGENLVLTKTMEFEVLADVA